MNRPELYKDMNALEESYYYHIEKVRAMIPPDRLLEFNGKEGWEPLCDFLGKPVPDTPFPHVNDRVVMRAMLGTLWIVTWIWPLVLLLVVYCLLIVFLRFIRLVRPPKDNTGAPTGIEGKKRQ